MNPENLQAEGEQKNPVFKITPLSKYLAMALFIILPFLGGWVGYTFVPVKIVEVQKEVIKEVVVKNDAETVTQQTVSTSAVSGKYVSPNGFSILTPAGSTVVEEPAQFSYSAITRISGDFGSLCISPGYGCGGKGAEGAIITTDTLSTTDGVDMKLTILRSSVNDTVIMVVQSLKPSPSSFSDSAQIQLFTTEENIKLAESLLASIEFLE